jgi:hypothetical protein
MKYGLTIVTGPSIKRETTMEQFIGLDVSLKDTFVSVREGGQRVWRGKCPSDPKLIAEVIRKRAPNAERVVFETGPLSIWFYHALTREGLPAICIDARHAKAALDMARNKTDANDADGLAHLAEVGFYRAVRVKSFDSMLTRTLVAARHQMIKATTQLSNQIRGLMKTFGLVVPKGAGRVFEGHVRSLLASNAGLEQIILPADPCRRIEQAAYCLSARERAMPAAVVDPGRRRGDRLVLCGRDRRPGKLQKVAFGGGMGRLNDQALPVRRSRLRGSYIPTRRQPSSRTAV